MGLHSGYNLTFFFKKKFVIYYFKKLFIYFWLCWVFVAMYGLSLVVVRGGCCIAAVHGFLIAVASLEQSMGSRLWASIVVAHGFSCPVVCGILPEQVSNLCSLH